MDKLEARFEAQDELQAQRLTTTQHRLEIKTKDFVEEVRMEAETVKQSCQEAKSQTSRLLKECGDAKDKYEVSQKEATREFRASLDN